MGLFSWLRGGDSDPPPKFNLEEHWRKCRQHVQGLRLSAVNVRSDLRQKEFAADIERLAEAYEDLIRELEANPIDIMSTGGVEGRLQELAEAVKNLLKTCRQRGVNAETLPEIERNRQQFREILAKVDADQSKLADAKKLDRKVRMEMLLRVIVPDKDKKKEP